MIKVNNTRKYPIAIDSIDGEYHYDKLITDGELILIKDNRDTCVGLIRCIKEWKSFVDPDDDFNNVGDISYGKNISKGVFEYWEPVKPIVISHTEKIEVGDWYYDERNKTINKLNYQDLMITVECGYFKIIALPEHFSYGQLVSIGYGSVKTGKVQLECTIDPTNNCEVIKLDHDGSVILHKDQEMKYTFMDFLRYQTEMGYNAIDFQAEGAEEKLLKWITKQ